MEPIQIGILGAAPIAPQALIAPASHVAEVAVYGTATRDALKHRLTMEVRAHRLVPSTGSRQTIV